MAASVDDRARDAPVLVTGATGYVAGWLIRRLLEAGAIVHASVRDPSDEPKIAHLKAMAAQAPGSIEFFAADLLRTDSFDEAMQDCAMVFHTASPFLAPDKVGDPQRDLVDPALKGTTTVLESANRTPSVTRVVLTSSGAAMSGGPADIAKAPGGVITEASWNTVSSLDEGPYLYSKTVAERTAWKMADAQNRWRLVVINPGLVLGPATADRQTSASFDYVRQLGDGTYRDAPPPMQLGMVDVRDVAEAHFRAGFVPDAEGRHIVAEGVHSLDELADLLKAEFGGQWPFPARHGLPDGAPRPKWDNSKSKAALGLTYRPIVPAVTGMFRQLVDTGQLTRS